MTSAESAPDSRAEAGTRSYMIQVRCIWCNGHFAAVYPAQSISVAIDKHIEAIEIGPCIAPDNRHVLKDLTFGRI